MNLGALPVVECNRWDPTVCPPALGGTATLERRIYFWSTEAGQAHQAELAAWEAARAAEAAEAAEAEALIAQSMSLVPDLISCQACGRQFEESLLDIQMRCPQCRDREFHPRLPSNPPEIP
jgi:predicted Zn-ribbon and HTH transcriptional regulator